MSTYLFLIMRKRSLHVNWQMLPNVERSSSQNSLSYDAAKSQSYGMLPKCLECLIFKKVIQDVTRQNISGNSSVKFRS